LCVYKQSDSEEDDGKTEQLPHMERGSVKLALRGLYRFDEAAKRKGDDQIPPCDAPIRGKTPLSPDDNERDEEKKGDESFIQLCRVARDTSLCIERCEKKYAPW
jgi:hypothetical protein